MSTTRSQKRKNCLEKEQQESTETVSECLVSPIISENVWHSKKDVNIAGPSNAKCPRIENCFLEKLRASLKEEITSEIKNLLVESQKETLKLLKPKTGEKVWGNADEEPENTTKNFYTPTKSVRIISTQNDDPNTSRNTRYGMLQGKTSKNFFGSVR